MGIRSTLWPSQCWPPVRKPLQRGAFTLAPPPLTSSTGGASATGGGYVNVYNPVQKLEFYNSKIGTILGSDFGAGNRYL